MHRIHGLIRDYGTELHDHRLLSWHQGHQKDVNAEINSETFRIHFEFAMQLRGGRRFDWGCRVWKSSQPGFHGSVCVLKWSLATEARDLCRAITFSNSQDQRGHPTCLNSKFPTVCAPGGVHRHESISKHMIVSSFMFQSSLTFEMSDIVEREHTVCNWAAMISLFYDSCMPVFACSWRVQA